MKISYTLSHSCSLIAPNRIPNPNFQQWGHPVLKPMSSHFDHFMLLFLCCPPFAFMVSKPFTKLAFSFFCCDHSCAHFVILQLASTIVATTRSVGGFRDFGLFSGATPMLRRRSRSIALLDCTSARCVYLSPSTQGPERKPHTKPQTSHTASSAISFPTPNST